MFAVVVVAMFGRFNTANVIVDPGLALGKIVVILGATSIILVSVIISLLYGIRELVLKMPRPPK